MNEHIGYEKLHELSQEAQSDAFLNLAEALILNPMSEIEPLTGELPTKQGLNPYAFQKDLPNDFIRKHLLLANDDASVVGGNATYYTSHRLHDDPNTYQSVTIAWTTQLPGSAVRVHQDISIEETMSQDGQTRFASSTLVEYSEPAISGGRARINIGNFLPSDDMSGLDVLRNVIEDYANSQGEATIDNIESVHAAAEFIRSSQN